MRADLLKMCAMYDEGVTFKMAKVIFYCLCISGGRRYQMEAHAAIVSVRSGDDGNEWIFSQIFIEKVFVSFNVYIQWREYR